MLSSWWKHYTCGIWIRIYDVVGNRSQYNVEMPIERGFTASNKPIPPQSSRIVHSCTDKGGVAWINSVKDKWWHKLPHGFAVFKFSLTFFDLKQPAILTIGCIFFLQQKNIDELLINWENSYMINNK